jgi:hypothetical protein
LDLIKLKIPNSQGKNDLETYLEWEKKVDWVFDCRSYSKVMKLKRWYGFDEAIDYWGWSEEI